MIAQPDGPATAAFGPRRPAPVADADRRAGRGSSHDADATPAVTPPEPFDLPRIERAVREILLAIGEDPDRDGLRDTPRRVARSYEEIFRGLRETPASHLGTVFEQHHDEAVIDRDIEFASVCEHHLLPFLGKAHVAYIPGGGEVAGLSKLARTVEVFARRPQVQERLTNQVADALAEHLSADGVAVVVEAEHLCMRMRGVAKAGSSMVTTALRGAFRERRDLGAEILQWLAPARR